jgi:hypothetical protein
MEVLLRWLSKLALPIPRLFQLAEVVCKKINSIRAFVVGSTIEPFGSIVEPNTKKSIPSGSTKVPTNC